MIVYDERDDHNTPSKKHHPMNEPQVAPPSRFFARLRPGRMFWLLCLALVALLVVYVIPLIPWATNGTFSCPVRVFAFDATQRTPIAKATVSVFRSPPVLGPNSLAAEGRNYRAERVEQPADAVHGTTDSDGMAVVNFEFQTSANNTRPAPEAHTRWVWVEVHAEGYGTTIVPVRHDSTKIADIQKLGELLVPVGFAAKGAE